MGGKLSIYQHGSVIHYDVSIPVKSYGKRCSFGIFMQEILATVWHMHRWVVYVISPKCVLPSLANFAKLPSLFHSSIVCYSASSRVITSRHLWYDMQALKLKLYLETGGEVAVVGSFGCVWCILVMRCSRWRFLWRLPSFLLNFVLIFFDGFRAQKNQSIFNIVQSAYV